MTKPRRRELYEPAFQDKPAARYVKTGEYRSPKKGEVILFKGFAAPKAVRVKKEDHSLGENHILREATDEEKYCPTCGSIGTSSV